MPPPQQSVYVEREDAGPKRFINRRLIPACVSGGPDNGGLFCVLDAETMRTTRALIACADVPADRILVIERNAETARAMRAPVGVRIRHDDVFRVLDELAVAGTPIHALVLDGMWSALDHGQARAIARTARLCGASLLFLTLAGRTNVRGRTLAARVAEIQRGSVGRTFRGLRFAYGYTRALESEPRRPGMPMMFLAFQRLPCETRYRPRVVRRDPDGRPDVVEVEWYGWPGEATLEPADRIPTADDDDDDDSDDDNVARASDENDCPNVLSFSYFPKSMPPRPAWQLPPPALPQRLHCLDTWSSFKRLEDASERAK